MVGKKKNQKDQKAGDAPKNSKENKPPTVKDAEPKEPEFKCVIAENNVEILALLKNLEELSGSSTLDLNAFLNKYAIQKCFLEVYIQSSIESQFKIFDFEKFNIVGFKDNYIRKLLHKTCTLFVYALRKAKAMFKEDQIQTERPSSIFYDHKTLLKEITPIYVNDKWRHLYKQQFYVNRSRYVKIPYVVQCITELNKHNSYNLASDELEFEIWETLKFEEEELLIIPEKLPDFIYTRMYCIQTKLKPSHIIRPGAQPIGQKVNDRDVYLRRDLWKLYTKSQWRNRGLDIKIGELPMKVMEITGWRDIEYYHQGQTCKLKLELTEDGKIPQNEYGNIETMNGLPPGTRHINLKGVKFVLKKMDIDWVAAVTEFEFKNGRFYPVLSGVVVHDRDYQMVMDEYMKRKEELENRETLKEDKLMEKMWKDIFKSLYTKKYFRDKQ